jgi:hypothetical protein
MTAWRGWKRKRDRSGLAVPGVWSEQTSAVSAMERNGLARETAAARSGLAGGTQMAKAPL